MLPLHVALQPLPRGEQSTGRRALTALPYLEDILVHYNPPVPHIHLHPRLSLHLFEYLDEVRVRVQPVEEEGGDGAHGGPAHAAGHERAVTRVRRGRGRGMA